MSLINNGGPSPQIVVRLLEAAIAADDTAVGAALDEAEQHADDVLDCLTLLVAGAVETFAILTKKSYEEILPLMWERMAATIDDSAVDVMKAMVTAYTSEDSTELVAAVEAAREEMPDSELIAAFVGTAVMLNRVICGHTGEPESAGLVAWREALGVAP